MRYIKNRKMLTIEENERLKNFQVTVVGCGGLGGYVVEMLARLGIGHLHCIDGDNFDMTNWNRQLYATEENLNESKAKAAYERVLAINSDVHVFYHHIFIDQNNAETLLSGSHVVVDALDTISGKLLLEQSCKDLNIPLIHGAIGGWYGQVTTVMPGNDTISYLYKRKQDGIEKSLGNPSFTPGTVASIQVAEVLKVLLNKGDILQNRILYLDLLNADFEILERLF